MAVKHIQVKNSTNYPKSLRGRKVLRFHLGDGLILHDRESHLPTLQRALSDWFSFTLTDPVHDVQRRTPFPLLNQKSVSALESTMEMASSLSMKGVEKKMIEIGKGSLTVDAFELSGETYIE
jgi:hypothetical protein